MRSLPIQSTLVDQAYEAILSDISAGKFGPESRLIQEELAESLGVSRQPIQQALLLLRRQGILRDAPGRGLMLAPLDPEYVRNVYEIRAMIDGLASDKAAERGRETAAQEGPAYIKRGRAAVASRSISKMIAADMDFHFFLYRLSGNPLVAEASAMHWSFLRRVMGEVLLRGETPDDIWNQHEGILAAVSAGESRTAERLAREHISHASHTLISELQSRPRAEPSAATSKRARGRH